MSNPFEKLVKKFKKDPDIDNPWAMAHHVQNKRKKKRQRKKRNG